MYHELLGEESFIFRKFRIYFFAVEVVQFLPHDAGLVAQSS